MRASAIALAIVVAIAVPNARAIEPSAEPAAPGGLLRVCLLEDDAPRAHRGSGRGFDLDVMKAVASDTGAAIELVWAPSRSGFSEIESSDLPLGRLARGECDAVASVPGSDSLGRLRDRLALSRPYYGAAFELIAAPEGPSTFAALRGRRVGVQLQSFAHLAAESLHLDWRVRPSPRETLELLDTGEVDAVLVWGPALATLGRVPDPRWSPPRALRWNEHVAVRRGSPWLATIDRVLERLAADGAIERLAREHGIPARAPFATVSDASALGELRRENEVAEP